MKNGMQKMLYNKLLQKDKKNTILGKYVHLW